MLVDDATRVYHTNPGTWYPDARIRQTSPSMSHFYAFNLAPGDHQITFRVGEVLMKKKVLIQAGSVTWSEFRFDPKQHPEDPTPRDCMAEGPAK